MPRHLPLEDVWEARGARWTEEAGWRVPDGFGDLAEEHRAVRTAVGVADLSHRGTLRLGGAERVDFLHRMLTADLAGVAPPGWRPALWLMPKGKVIAAMRVIVLEEAALVDLAPEGAEAYGPRLEMYVLSSDVTIADETVETVTLSCHGPEVRALLGEILGDVALPTGWEVAVASVDGAEVLVIPSTWSGEEGFDLVLPAAAARGMWDRLASGTRARPIGAAARETLRIEAGEPRYAVDYGEETIPLEANLEAAISFTKGCFPGQEVVARATHRGGMRRKLRGLVLEGAAPPPSPRTPVFAGDEEAGWISSAVASPSVGRPIALAYLRNDKIDSGPLEVRSEDGSRAAELVTLPFYRRDSG